MNGHYVYHDRLESARLSTRFLTAQDVPAWSGFFRDSEAVEFLRAFVRDHGDPAAFWIEKQLQRYQNREYGLQALISKDTNAFIGQCGLLLQEVNGKKELEVGYHIFRQYWGQGFAPEAARLFMDFAARHRQAESVISIIDVHNVKSQRVAEKNGLKIDKQTTWHEMDVLIYRKRL